MNDSSGTTIVVGVDGSPSSRAALVWATREAALRGASLHAVQAWETPLGALPALRWTRADFDSEAKRELTAIIEDAVGKDLDIDLRTSVAEGNPVDVLVQAADEDHAELLVLGNRGRSTLKSLLLGSVSERCVTHAHCPVAVIRPTSQSRREHP